MSGGDDPLVGDERASTQVLVLARTLFLQH